MSSFDDTPTPPKALARLLRLTHWASLRQFCRSRLIRSSIVWVALVPIAAKVVHLLQRKVTKPDWASAAVASLEVPFTWQVLFWSAVAFSAAVWWCDWRCPRVVLDQRSFGEFQAQGRGTNQLVDYLQEFAREGEVWIDVVNKSTGWIADGIALTWQWREPAVQDGVGSRESVPVFSKTDVCAPMYPTSSGKPEVLMTIEDYSFQDAFWAVWASANEQRVRSRVGVGLLLLGGLVGAGIVFAENVRWVLLRP